MQEARRLNQAGLAAFQAGNKAEALKLVGQAAELHPEEAEYRNNFGELLRLSGRFEEALAQFDKALALNPDYAQALNNRGSALRYLKRSAEAEASYRAALKREPDYAEALNNLANLVQDQGGFAEAADLYRRAAKLKPGVAMIHHNLGLSLDEMGRRDEAMVAYAEAVRLDPKMANAQIAIGDIEKDRGNIEAALDYYERAATLDANNGEARIRIGLTLLLKGEYARGFEEFGWRWTLDSMKIDRRPFTQPRWNGEPLPPGRKLLLQTEQGAGEQMLFLSVLPDLLARGIDPVVECEPRMAPLIQRSFPAIEVVHRANPPNIRLFAQDLAAQSSFAELARLYRKSPSDCTGALVLKADPEKTARLRERYHAGLAGKAVGVAWRSANPKLGKPKSAPLTDFAAFLSLPGFRFIDLQYGDTAPDRAALQAATGVAMLHDTDVDQLSDLDSFAAQVAALDLVITTSNTTAHMAGALGVPVWVLLPKAITPHWYWGLAGETTPWYPTMRLIRQGSSGDWRGLASQVAERLKTL